MPNKHFTNAPRTGAVTLPLASARHRPFTSKSASYTQLTEKEKQARRAKQASDFGYGSYGSDLSMNTSMATAGQFYSPQLSTDFLELPQSLKEKREVYRHFYATDPIVGQAIDVHTELPLSKIRLGTPKPTTFPKGFENQHDYASYILWFFSEMCDRIKLFQRLETIVHNLWLDGSVFVWAEDSEVDVPQEVGHRKERVLKSVVTEAGEAREDYEDAFVEGEDREEKELAYYQKHYLGWDRLIVLPMDQVKVTTYSFTEKMKIELIPADRDRALIEEARAGDPFALEMVEEIPEEVRQHMEGGQNIPLGTDPDEGSFAYCISGRRSGRDELGPSILERCIRVLTYREKLRQAQTQIASRNMTPKRIVWGDRISEMDVMDLREQVDLALVDPDYSIVTNYEIHWEEMGSRDRLLDLSSEYEQTEKQLYAGLGVTESLLSGEAIYSGDRLKLEVINTRYLFMREKLQEYVEEYLFKPVARRKGFVEKNKWGGEVVLYPRLTFTRLPLRDSQDTYDALFNLYQKGSVGIKVILDLFGLDAEDAKVNLEEDMFTVNDALFNEVLRGVYNVVAQKVADSTDVTDKIIKSMGLKKVEAPPQEEEGRFG